MRIVLVPVALLAFATPALAHDDRGRTAADAAAAAELLGDPRVQDLAADRLSAAVAAMLDLRIGGLERAVDPGSRAHPDETLRDHLDRDDPDFEARLHHRTRRAVGAAGAVSGELAAMLPELQARLAAIKHRLRTGDYDTPPAAPPPIDDEDEFGDDWDD